MKNKSMLLIFTLLSGFSLSSCNNIKAVETVKISVWSEPKEQEVMEKVIEKWNKNHNNKHQIEIEFSNKLANYYNEEIIDELPGLFYAADSSLPNLIKNDLVYKIDEKKAKEIVENNVYVAHKGFEYNNGIYGYPVTVDNGYFMWYNKSLISESDVKSLESILKVTKEKNKLFYFDIDNGWYANSFIMSSQACGVDSLKWYENEKEEVYYEATWDNETGVKVSKYINDLFYDSQDYIIPGSGSGMVERFYEGDITIYISGLWNEDIFYEGLKENLGACKLPQYHIDGQEYQMASFGGSKGYFVNKNKSEKEIQTANLLAQLLTSKEAQLIRYELNKKIPTRREALKDKRFTQNASIGENAFAEQSEFACVQSQVADDRYWDVGNKLGEAYLYQKYDKNTWAKFLKELMDELRTPEKVVIYD